MSDITNQQILDALKGVIDPVRKSDVVSLGMISGLMVKDGHVGFALEVPAERGREMEPLRKAAEKAVHDLPGVLSATVVLTAERSGGKEAPAQEKGASHGRTRAGETDALLPGVRAIVAVASGKGGVGKSTTAANLALGLSLNGLKVGLLDADIYGPSMPRMMGISGRPSSPDGKVLMPMENYGIKVMSIGFMVAEDTPMIWRGPMVMGALQQMMKDVMWGELDILVVDMPPGTGDAQLTMSQNVPLAGAVIVSTPQDIALLDARKGLNMFRKVDVPVLGLIENMSYFLCPSCGERTEIFGHGGARAEAQKLGMDFLGEIPLHLDIRVTSDGGQPITVSKPDSPHAKVYREIAKKIWEKVEPKLEKAGPRIVFQ